jgi:hypothetical protein
MTRKDKFKPKTETELKETAVPYVASRTAKARPGAQPAEDQGWADFRDQCRRQMERPLALRIKYGFARPIYPSPDEPHWRIFKTMADYRAWCEKNLPDYLGFKRPSK